MTIAAAPPTLASGTSNDRTSTPAPKGVASPSNSSNTPAAITRRLDPSPPRRRPPRTGQISNTNANTARLVGGNNNSTATVPNDNNRPTPEPR